MANRIPDPLVLVCDGSKISAGNQWQDYCQKPAAIHEVSGNHYTMLEENHVDNLAVLFNKFLTDEG